MPECRCCFEDVAKLVPCPEGRCDGKVCAACTLGYKEHQGKSGCMFCNPLEAVVLVEEEDDLYGYNCCTIVLLFSLLFVGLLIFVFVGGVKLYSLMYFMYISVMAVTCNPGFYNPITYLYECIFGYLITFAFIALCACLNAWVEFK